MKMRYIAFVILIVGVLYGLVILNKIDDPPSSVDWWNSSAGEAILKTGKPFLLDNPGFPHIELLLEHPLLYVYLVAFAFKIFGIGILQARIVGIILFLLTLLLIFVFCRSLYPDNKYAPLLALIFYGLHPIAVQGSFLIDIDNTVLAFCTVIFFFGYIKSYELPDKIRIFIRATALFLMLSAKLVPLPVVILSMVIDYSVRTTWIRGLKEVIKISLLGFFIYFIINSIVYFMLGFGEYIFEQYVYIVTIFFRLFSRSFRSNIFFQQINTIVRLMIWVSPFLILLLIYSASQQARDMRANRKIQPDFIIWIYVVIVLLLSLITGKLTYGYPKMQSSVMPLLVIFVAGHLSLKEINRKHYPVCIGLVVFAVIFLYFVVGDVLYSVNYAAKELLIFANGTWARDVIAPVFLYVSLPVFLFVLIKVFCRKLGFRAGVVLSLAISLIASNIYICIVHARVDYLTSCDYGTRGKKELIGFINDITSTGEVVFTTPDIFYALKPGLLNVLDNETWLSSPERFIDYIREKHPDVLVFGITVNTVSHFENILNDKEFLNFLGKSYRKKNIGSYSVWVSARKKF